MKHCYMAIKSCAIVVDCVVVVTFEPINCMYSKNSVYISCSFSGRVCVNRESIERVLAIKSCVGVSIAK